MANTKDHIFLNQQENKRSFDLPLQQRLGTEFLVMLIGLMTLLATLSGFASMSLSHLSQTWKAGLENTLTLEIPAKGDTRAAAQEQARKVLDLLLDDPSVKKADILSDDEYEKLLSPWLGSGVLNFETLPLPVMINVELKERDSEAIAELASNVKSISPDIKVDAHETWLRDLANLAHGVNLGALALIVFIGFVTMFSIAGAVRSRMAVHQAELELLHLMGASDSYILSQFRRYILGLALRGLLVGFIVCAVFVAGFGLLGHFTDLTLPRVVLQGHHAVIPALVAAFMLVLCLGSARWTVLHVLKEMP